MYLMDSLAETAASVQRDRRQGAARVHPALDIFPALNDRLTGAPRYLLDDKAIRTATELSLGRPKVILGALQHVRLRYPKMWVEWEEKGRERLREVFDDIQDPMRPVPARVGVFLECDETGRKGHATWLWSGNNPGGILNIGPIVPYFDLDNRRDQPDIQIQAFLKGNLAHLWKDNPVQLAALFEIWRTAYHAPFIGWGERLLAEMVAQHGEIALAHALADVYGEYIMIWSIVLLLTSSRPIVEEMPVDRSRLNRARARRQQSQLYDHSIVTLHLDRAALERQRRAPLGYLRKSPRVHLVSAYLVTRGTQHRVVQPYWRGSGEIMSRHVRVKG